MNKLITTAFLMTLVSASYVQELTYLNCQRLGEAVSIAENDMWILNLDAMTHEQIVLWDDAFIENFDAETIEKNFRKINGYLFQGIEHVNSKTIILLSSIGGGSMLILDRISGDMWHAETPDDIGWSCAPINKSQAEALLQERINRKEEIINANEAKRLF
jgi:hypothetical protein